MIRILDRYILKKYFTVFFFTVLAFILIICAIDFAEKNDDFMKHKLSYDIVFSKYYLNLVPALANYLSPLFVFISTIVVVSMMASNTEIVAILSSGVSYQRFLYPFILGAILLAGITFYLIGWTIPKSNVERVDFEVKYLKKTYRFSDRDVHFLIEPHTYAYLQSYNTDINVGYHFTLETFEGKKLVSKLKTNRIAWDSTTGKWNMSDFTIRTYNGEKEAVTRYQKSDTLLNLYPRDFGSRHNYHQTLTFPQLKNYIAEQKIRGLDNVDIYIIEYYDRLAYPFAIIIMTLMGVVISSKKSREGVAFKIVTGFLLAVAYFIFLQLGRVFVSDGNIHPMLGSWIPNLVFIVIGIYLYIKTPK